MSKKDSAFTLVELMVVVAVVAILAAIAIPNLLSSRLAANETAALATLRNLVTAQTQFKARGAVDQDSGLSSLGEGEYGYFAELAGGVVPRSSLPNPPTKPLNPPILSGSFAVLSDVQGEGAVQRAGYFFKVFLPDERGLPVAELPAGGQAVNSAAADNQEVTWCAYAWPVAAEHTGLRVFFVNAQGEILQNLNESGVRYGGTGTQAGFVPIQESNALAAFAQGSGNMLGSLATNGLGVDGNLWTSVGN